MAKTRYPSQMDHLQRQRTLGQRLKHNTAAAQLSSPLIGLNAEAAQLTRTV